MTAIFVLFWLLLSATLFLLTIVLKGLEALVEATVDTGELLAWYFFGGICMLGLYVLILMFTGSFWAVIGYGLLIFFLIGAVVTYLGVILEFLGTIAAYVFVALLGIVMFFGEYSESGLQYCLNKLNKHVMRS